MSKKDFFEGTYSELFPDEQSKAKAFDKLAECYFNQNFGTMQKAEVDLLLFAEYLNRIIDNSELYEKYYSDFELSKQLGITRSRVASFKERKELKYPSKFRREDSFIKVLEKAEYSDDKVKLYIKDIRLYSKLCEIIDGWGSYSETTLTKQLLVVSIPVFVDLMVEASDDNEKEEKKKQLKEILENNDYGSSYFTENWTLRDILKEEGPDMVCKIVSGLLEQNIPIVGGTAAVTVEHIF